MINFKYLIKYKNTYLKCNFQIILIHSNSNFKNAAQRLQHE